MHMEQQSLSKFTAISSTSCCVPELHHLPSQHQSKRQKKAFTVTFSEKPVFCSIPSDPSLDQVESILTDTKQSLWYSSGDTAQMKQNARRQCEHLKCIHKKKLNVFYSSHGRKLSRKLTLAYNSSTRGLEYLTCTERKRRRYITIRLIVDIASKMKQLGRTAIDDDKLIADASIKCTKYASYLAMEEALRDYKRAYHGIENDNDEGFEMLLR